MAGCGGLSFNGFNTGPHILVQIMIWVPLKSTLVLGTVVLASSHVEVHDLSANALAQSQKVNGTRLLIIALPLQAPGKPVASNFGDTLSQEWAT